MEPRPPLSPRFTARQLLLAFAIAVAADGLSFVVLFAPPLQWAIDLLTAALLFMVLGRQWLLLPGLVMEAIPFLSLFPLWILVVAAVAVWGTPRPAGVLPTDRRFR